MYRYLDFKKIYEDAAVQQTAQDMVEQSGLVLNLELSSQNVANLTSQYQSVDNPLVAYAIDPMQSDPKKQSKTVKVYFEDTPIDVAQNAESPSDSYVLPLTQADIEALTQGSQLSAMALRAPDDPAKAAVAVVNGQNVPVKANVVVAGSVTAPQSAEQAAPSEPQMQMDQTASELPTQAELLPGIAAESSLINFSDFLRMNEAKKKEQWIKDVKMKKGALKKELGDDELTFADLEKAEDKLKKKDKDPKKKGLQLDKKDSTLHKRLTLAKNLMKAKKGK